MTSWEYVCIRWSDKGVYLWPGEKFELKWIEEWLQQNLPQLHRARIGEFPGRIGGLGGHKWNTARGYRIDTLFGFDADVAIALIQHLGSQGWEAIRLSGDWEYGSSWFKRRLPE